MITYDDIKNSKGNVLKVRLGKRIIYVAIEHVYNDIQFVGYQVNKEGEIRYSKWTNKYFYDLKFSQIEEIIPIYAEQD